MNKGAGIGIGIFLILLIVGGLFVYSYTQLSVSLNDVKFHTIDKLLEMLEDDTISHFFNICFKKKNN